MKAIKPKVVKIPTWPALMKRATAALYLDVSTTTFDSWVNAGRIPVVHPTIEAMYRRMDLDAFIASLHAPQGASIQ